MDVTWFLYSSGLLHWHWGDRMIALVQVGSKNRSRINRYKTNHKPRAVCKNSWIVIVSSVVTERAPTRFTRNEMIEPDKQRIYSYYREEWPIEAEWRIYASIKLPALVQTMACRLVGTKPLSEPMLEYC